MGEIVLHGNQQLRSELGVLLHRSKEEPGVVSKAFS